MTAIGRIENKKYLVLSVDEKTTGDGRPYLQLWLADKDGKIGGKIWSEARNRCQVEKGKVIEVTGKYDVYQGIKSVMIGACQILDGENPADFAVTVPTLVFDIETSGKDFEDLDGDQQKYLVETLGRDEPDKEIAKTKSGLYAIFGRVVAIGWLDYHENKGKALVFGQEKIEMENSDFEAEIYENEKELLTAFWRESANFRRWVTFNGEDFDIPYLVIRSAINRVRVPVEFRHNDENMIDLAIKFRQGRKYQLAMLSKAFGIDNPKSGGVNGAEVTELVKQKKFSEIANYVARDVVATAKLFGFWRDFLSIQG